MNEDEILDLGLGDSFAWWRLLYTQLGLMALLGAALTTLSGVVVWTGNSPMAGILAVLGIIITAVCTLSSIAIKLIVFSYFRNKISAERFEREQRITSDGGRMAFLWRCDRPKKRKRAGLLPVKLSAEFKRSHPNIEVYAGATIARGLGVEREYLVVKEGVNAAAVKVLKIAADSHWAFGSASLLLDGRVETTLEQAIRKAKIAEIVSEDADQEFDIACVGLRSSAEEEHDTTRQWPLVRAMTIYGHLDSSKFPAAKRPNVKVMGIEIGTALELVKRDSSQEELQRAVIIAVFSRGRNHPDMVSIRHAITSVLTNCEISGTDLSKFTRSADPGILYHEHDFFGRGRVG